MLLRRTNIPHTRAMEERSRLSPRYASVCLIGGTRIVLKLPTKRGKDSSWTAPKSWPTFWRLEQISHRSSPRCYPFFRPIPSPLKNLVPMMLTIFLHSDVDRGRPFPQHLEAIHRKSKKPCCRSVSVPTRSCLSSSQTYASSNTASYAYPSAISGNTNAK